MISSTFALTSIFFGLIVGVAPTEDGKTGAGPEELFETLKEEQKAEQEAFRQAIAQEEFGSDSWNRIYEEHAEQRKAFGERALELARDHPNDEVAVDALIWILGCSPETMERAFQRLASDYIGSEKLEGACISAAGMEYPSAEKLLRTAMAMSPHWNVRGVASYMLATHLELRARRARFLEQERDPDRIEEFARQFDTEEWELIAGRSADEHFEEVEASYEQVIDNYADASLVDRFGNRLMLGMLAEGKLFRLRNLTEGKTAPEIEGEDVEGNRFKLSDYRGKVVVLTFSGNWCGPCRAMYPHERELVERLKAEPFALLSVNTDADRTTLEEAISTGEITWRCWDDGGTDGPITKRWGISEFPTVYVLDDRGVIRYTNVRGEQLDEAVHTLLEEINAEAETGVRGKNSTQPERP